MLILRRSWIQGAGEERKAEEENRAAAVGAGVREDVPRQQRGAGVVVLVVVVGFLVLGRQHDGRAAERDTGGDRALQELACEFQAARELEFGWLTARGRDQSTVELIFNSEKKGVTFFMLEV